MLGRIHSSWLSWRGRVIEPVIREAIDRLPSAKRPHGNGVVGGYWTRSNDPEIDIVLADRAPNAQVTTSRNYERDAIVDRLPVGLRSA